MTLHEENDTRSPQDIKSSNDGIMKTVNELCNVGLTTPNYLSLVMGNTPKKKEK